MSWHKIHGCIIIDIFDYGVTTSGMRKPRAVYEKPRTRESTRKCDLTEAEGDNNLMKLKTASCKSMSPVKYHVNKEVDEVACQSIS